MFVETLLFRRLGIVGVEVILSGVTSYVCFEIENTVSEVAD